METKQITPPTPLRVLRLREVEERTGLKRASIYRRGKVGTFPKPISLGRNSTGWIESEVEAWLADLVAQRDAQAGAQ